MTPAVWGAVLGLGSATGLVLVAGRVVAMRRPPLEARVLPYVRDLVPGDRTTPTAEPRNAAGAVFGPLLRQAAALVERVVGGAPRRAEAAKITDRKSVV